MQDFSKVSIDGAGIDLKTLMNDGFPQLKFENAMVIEKLFENIRREMDVKTKRVTFDSFLSLVKSFMTTDIDIKVNRFFQLIDEDGNGELSMDEILNLCQRSFQSMKSQDADPEEDKFYDELAEFFAKFIFEKTKVDIDDEITPDQLATAITEDKEGAQLLEMFCGEALIKLY